jgi:hypothetical protein
MKTLKKNNPLWQKAIRYSRRKYANAKPIGFNQNGTRVIFSSLIRGNLWERTEKELDLLLRKPSSNNLKNKIAFSGN